MLNFPAILFSLETAEQSLWGFMYDFRGLDFAKTEGVNHSFYSEK